MVYYINLTAANDQTIFKRLLGYTYLIFLFKYVRWRCQEWFWLWSWSVFVCGGLTRWNKNISTLEHVLSQPSCYFRRRNFWNIRNVLRGFWEVVTFLLSESSQNIPNVSKSFGGEGSWKIGLTCAPNRLYFHFVESISLKQTLTKIVPSQNHTRQRQTTYLNKDTRFSLTNSWNLVDCLGR